MLTLAVKRRTTTNLPWRLVVSGPQGELENVKGLLLDLGGSTSTTGITFPLDVDLPERLQKFGIVASVETEDWAQNVRRVRATLDEVRNSARVDLPLPYADKLYAYQTVGAKWLSTIKRGMLADEPGVGKTIQALAAADLLGAQRVLIVTISASVQKQWKETIETWGLGPVSVIGGTPALRARTMSAPAKWYVMTASMLSTTDEAVKSFVASRWDVVIADEAHTFQGKDSKRTKLLASATQAAGALFLLTGTPVWNKGPSLWSLLHLIDPYRWSTEWDWLDKYFNIRTTPFGRTVGDIKPHMRDALRMEVGSVILRRTMTDVGMTTPEVQMVERPLEMPLKLRMAYTDMRRDITAYKTVTLGGQQHTITARTQSIPLTRALLNNPALKELEDQDLKLREVQGIVATTTGQVLIFTWYTAYTDRIAASIPGAAAFHGKKTPEARACVLENFRQGRTRVLVASVAALGTGVDLPDVNVCVFAEMEWTYAIIEQSWRRILRITSTQSKTVYLVYYKASVEELIKTTFTAKKKMSEAMISQSLELK